MCQGCIDKGRVTAKVADAILAFEALWPRSAYGPAHNVIDDWNVEDHNIQWCLDNWNSFIEINDPERQEEYDETWAFLKSLLLWPVEDRVPGGSTDRD